MVHKPKHKVHGFRGLLGDGGEDEINLERQNANVAYRIVKLEMIGIRPSTTKQESTLKIYKTSQSSVTDTVDFSDSDLLGVIYRETDSGANSNEPAVVIFDQEIFSQNIYVTHVDENSAAAANYYIEIEEVPVSASALIQLKLGTARRNISGKIGPTPG